MSTIITVLGSSVVTIVSYTTVHESLCSNMLYEQTTRRPSRGQKKRFEILSGKQFGDMFIPRQTGYSAVGRRLLVKTFPTDKSLDPILLEYVNTRNTVYCSSSGVSSVLQRHSCVHIPTVHRVTLSPFFPKIRFRARKIYTGTR